MFPSPRSVSFALLPSGPARNRRSRPAPFHRVSNPHTARLILCNDAQPFGVEACMGTVAQWMALVGYGVVLFLVAPRAGHHRGFLWARSRQGAAPSPALLTGSVLVTWIFAKSITNAANLGEKYGLVGGLAYAAWYLSIPAAGILIYRIRKAGHEGIIPFLTARFGPAAAFLFSAAIVIRLFNEVWSNTEVVASYFGPDGFYIPAAAFTARVLVYTMRGRLRASIFTDPLH